MKRTSFVLIAITFVIVETILIGFVDRPLSEYLRIVDSQHTDYINIFRSYTDIGKSKYWLIVSGISAFLCALALRIPPLQPKTRQRLAQIGEGLLFFFISIAASGIIADIIKPVLGRARPVMLDREGFYGFHPLSFSATMNSMPSGHSTTAFAIASVLTFFFPRGHTYWLLFAAAIAVSRVMVNAHYLSDVFAGDAVGFLTVLSLRTQINHNVKHHIISSIFPIDRKNTAN